MLISLWQIKNWCASWIFAHKFCTRLKFKYLFVTRFCHVGRLSMLALWMETTKCRSPLVFHWQTKWHQTQGLWHITFELMERSLLTVSVLMLPVCSKIRYQHFICIYIWVYIIVTVCCIYFIAEILQMQRWIPDNQLICYALLVIYINT